MNDSVLPKSNTRIYRTWQDIKRRCLEPTRKSYPNYGGRGIKLQESWKTFRGFWEDMGAEYEEHLTIERLDVNGDYCKSNCCWIEKKYQAKNKRKYSNNTLGVANIKIMLHRGIPNVLARIQEPGTEKRIIKQYSLRKYTQEEAVKLANEWLAEKRKFYGYSGSHGS